MGGEGAGVGAAGAAALRAARAPRPLCNGRSLRAAAIPAAPGAVPDGGCCVISGRPRSRLPVLPASLPRPPRSAPASARAPPVATAEAAGGEGADGRQRLRSFLAGNGACAEGGGPKHPGCFPPPRPVGSSAGHGRAPGAGGERRWERGARPGKDGQLEAPRTGGVLADFLKIT